MSAAAKQNAFSHPSLDPDHMLRVRQKEIENSRKTVEVNNNLINKMKARLTQLGGYDESGEPNWE